MHLSNNEILIILSLIIITSYLFNFITQKIKIPSVLLLISTGVILKLTAENMGIVFLFPQSSLELMGTLGLILIVLEASLDLKITKEEIPLIRNAFFAALVILIISSGLIAFAIQWWLDISLKKSLINAIPLAVISSAIAIPSVALFNKKIRNFIIYESTFSDILGIMLFNYVIQDNVLNLYTLGDFGINVLLILLISFGGSALLIFLINKITHKVKFFLILSILLLIYEIGKQFHLPSLLLVLVFGLMIGNSKKLMHNKISGYFNPEKLQADLPPFITFTEETAFLIRTFFFVLFGFSVNLKEIMDYRVVLAGLTITGISLLIRYLYLRITVKEGYRITKLFLAPRGLITVILFYSIPLKYIVPEFSIGIVFFVIITSGLLMMISLWSGGKDGNDISPGHDQLQTPEARPEHANVLIDMQE
jgi:NhaP-type Na+/H+ or K+/H+ antiporter